MTFFSQRIGTGTATLFALALLPGLAAAQAPAGALMQEMAGVYKHRFANGVIVPGKDNATVPAEDVIEIVPVDQEHIYVRAHLNFFNGHMCGIAAVARYDNGAFVYRDPAPAGPGLPQCVMKVGIDKGRLSITDRLVPDGERTCDQYCGARASLNYDIGMDQRRAIRYLAPLKASREYRAALDAMPGR